ncbi:cysteine-rich CWC family protein [Segetibacter aerophilus]|uniref:cysteine-rich CWC family protein n=1 Tax=Segetibacter aerophilus TaxID=670293 RepID=UPI0011BE74A7
MSLAANNNEASLRRTLQLNNFFHQKLCMMHETKTCPCCNKSFECKSGSITICQCMEVYVSQATREFLAKQYDECLCKACLIETEEICSRTGSAL